MRYGNPHRRSAHPTPGGVHGPSLRRYTLYTVSKRKDYGALQPRPYRGSDRRSVIASDRASAGGFIIGAAVVGLGVWTLAASGVIGSPPPAQDALLPGGRLDAAAAAVGVVAAALCFVRWRLVGDAAALWFGGAALLLSGAVLGANAATMFAGGDSVAADALGWLPPALRLAAAGLLALAARTAQVDAGLGPRRVLATGVAATLTGVVLLVVAPGLARAVASLGDTLPAVEATATGSVVLTGIWLTLAIAHAHRGRRDRHWLHLWFGLALLSLGLAETLWLLPGTPASAWPAGPGLLAAYALLCMLAGATGEFVRAFSEQRGRLLETVTSELTAEARVRAEQLLAQERAHEARNALTAIEGASRTLETYRDRLDPETQASLSRAISAEIARLQQLVSPDDAPDAVGEFRLADTLTSVVVGARTRGTAIDMRVPEEFVACGRPGETAEVVQNLVENARRYAPGSVVVIRAHEQRGGVVVRVEDRGPGVPAAEHEAVFGRGFRGQDAASVDGTGLGLYICARLMREQGGDLWVEDRPGGGASFALWLPAPSAPGQGEAPAARTADGQTAVTRTTRADNVFPLFGAGEPPAPPRAAESGREIGTSFPAEH